MGGRRDLRFLQIAALEDIYKEIGFLRYFFYTFLIICFRFIFRKQIKAQEVTERITGRKHG